MRVAELVVIAHQCIPGCFIDDTGCGEIVAHLKTADGIFHGVIKYAAQLERCKAVIGNGQSVQQNLQQQDKVAPFALLYGLPLLENLERQRFAG